MTQNKHEKRAARKLAALRAIPYSAALRELRELPAGTDWAAYLARVAGGLVGTVDKRPAVPVVSLEEAREARAHRAAASVLDSKEKEKPPR
jgi:hypothetical protein